ncbi:hypothetical protein [Formosa sp. A9]|uniref:hypothetical protein n=1 Tax=Formosa sp. A9 TaxID=3442641 RepID=UPI003EB8DBE9
MENNQFHQESQSERIQQLKSFEKNSLGKVLTTNYMLGAHGESAVSHFQKQGSTLLDGLTKY